MAKHRKKLKPNRYGKLRPWVQLCFAVLFLGWTTLQFHSICAPVFHCYACPLSTFSCPIGILASFAAAGVLAIGALAVVVIAGALVGSFVCGWACPFGFLQDLIAKVPVPKVRIPHWMGYSRYLVLVLFVFLMPYLFGKEDNYGFICNVCPAGGIEGGLPSVAQQYQQLQAQKGEIKEPAADASDDTGGVPAEFLDGEDPATEPDPVPSPDTAPTAEPPAGGGIRWPSPLKLYIMGLFVVASLVFFRPWCTVLCPLGAMLGSFNRVSAVFMRFSPKKCRQCGLCTAACKMGIEPTRAKVHPSCIRCLECSRCTYIRPGTVFSKTDEDEVRR